MASESMRRGFLQAARDEYVNGQQDAVGDFFEENPGAERQLAPYEDRIRQAADPEREYRQIQKEWAAMYESDHGNDSDIRFNPDSVDPHQIPAFANLTPEQQERKMQELHSGAELASTFAPFPSGRKCQDALWGPFFALVGVAIIGLAAYYSKIYVTESEKYFERTTLEEACSGFTTAETCPAERCTFSAGHCATKEFVNLFALAGAGLCGAFGSICAAFAYTLLMKMCPTCVVYTALIFGPVSAIISGLSMIATGQQIMMIMGGLMVALGFCMLFCTFCCWRHLIPFMIKLTEVVATIMGQHPAMVLISLVGGALSVVWTLACSLAFMGVYMTHFYDWKDLNDNYRPDAEDRNTPNAQVSYPLIFVSSLLFIWGGQVAYNVCHVTYAGVFGRWYYGKDKFGGVTLPSISVALTTSFGSICLGSLLVAIVQAVEATVRAARRDAQEDGNMVLCVVLCIVECVINCIGDILEYFSEWAYIQCAIRGVSFCDAARITYAMCTCANINYILQDMLLGSLVSLGSMMCAFVGCISGGAFGYFMDSAHPELAYAGLVIGFVVGMLSGSCAVAIISSGIKTILVCWAENPQRLKETQPELHMEFSSRIRGYMNQ